MKFGKNIKIHARFPSSWILWYNELFEEEKAEKKKDLGMRKNKNLKILIFSQFISMLDRIEIALKAIGKEGDTIRIDGSMERTERDQKIKKFSSQVEDAPKIFLLSARVGGEGLNLTAATRVIIVDPSWNISDDNQIADRVFRIGQKEDVTVYRLVTCMTIEEDIYKTQILKGNLARAILEGKVCSPLVELEDRKFIRLPECGFNSSKTQQLLETLMGDILEMRSRHQRFLQKHHLVAGLTNQEVISSHEEISLIDLPLGESSDEEASSSEERHATKASKGAKSYKHCHHSKKPDDASLEHEEDSLTTTSRRIYIPANKVGALIGTGGNTIERIKIRSSAIIRINPDGHWRGKFPDPCPVEIRGTLREITTAVQLITEAVSKENETYIEGATDGGVEIHFSVPQHMIGLIIGSGGRRVQSIEHESGARISHIKHESKFRIRGTLEEVNNAKGIMSDIINKHAGSSSYGGEGKRILKQDHKAQVSGESTHDRPPGSFYTTRATGLSSGRGSGHMYRSAMHHTLRPPQGMPSPRARSEYYGERGTGIAFSPPGNFEHQLEGQNYHPRIGPEDCRDQIQDTVLWPGEEPPTKG
ncbi:hypothetical protein SETIT_5G125200v2 [Setaria italica]|uniref:Helicase C-terminal domain-containing protein n=2 Tax=Setaria italica TaxID=4555 RepID=A0A368R450_SETIT|nr:hypothetical protein SETIT_5G125200v2 [Setaria italica]